MTPQEAFITRLRRHRERNQISLGEMAAVTRMKCELLEAFERNDLSNWPRGLYARAWVRAYAGVVGLDPLDTVTSSAVCFSTVMAYGPHGGKWPAASTRIRYHDDSPQPPAQHAPLHVLTPPWPSRWSGPNPPGGRALAG